MTLTKRERILVSILIVIIVLAGYFKVLILPQLEKIDELKTSVKAYNEKIPDMNELNNSISSVNKEYDKLSLEFEGYNNKYFSDLHQDEIIFIISEILNKTDLNIQSINFSESKEEKIDENNIKVVTVNLPYSGKYNSLKNLLLNIESYHKMIMVNDLSINKDKDNVNGNISLDFNCIDILNKEKLVTWSNENGNVNPFDFNDITISKEYDIQISLGPDRVILENFEDKDFEYDSDRNGEVWLSKYPLSKKGKYSLKTDLVFDRDEDKSVKILMDNININKPAEKIKMWVYAFEKSKSKLSITIEDEEGKNNILLANEIDWLGWKQLEYIPTQDEDRYPLIVKDIKISNTANNTFLIDDLEAYYGSEKINDSIIKETEDFIHYQVQPKDTLKTINDKFFSYDMTKKIIRYNDLKSNSLKVGQVLIIPKNVRD
ncbi:MAG: LysM peptidoglycan-binding domain-containing protein [Firmicutes bacterium]|nr:LysM peptidoglycan-binding domain-containing protein [Bacillota bacterium]